MKPSPFPILPAAPAAAPDSVVRGLLARDRKATAEFVASHADVIHAYVSRRLFPRSDLVEDMVQDVFLDALRGLPGYRGESPVRHWLLAIARHKIQDYYRRRILEVEIEEDSPDPGAGLPIDILTGAEDVSVKVKETMATLPDAYRSLLLWRYWEKVPAAQMAARLNKTEKSVERMLARARDHFRRRWQHER
ncbi:MAG: sigma-70 family RNA polymerase sigma factor [Bryobacterales bacterium]|nr:sigma-70 family RNA polymerase sigma factor [Bryobacterales bacterium]